MSRFGLLMMLAGCGASHLAAQSVVGIARTVPGSPAHLVVDAAQGQWLEPEGLTINATLVNASATAIEAFEVLVIGLSPFNDVQVATRISRAVNVAPNAAGEATVRYRFLSRSDIYVVVAVVTRVRFFDDRVWNAPPDAIDGVLAEISSELGFSADAWSALGRGLQGRAGAYAFSEITLSSDWDGPRLEAGCAEYTAGRAGAASLTLSSGQLEVIFGQPGDRLIVCDRIVHVLPGAGVGR